MLADPITDAAQEGLHKSRQHQPFYQLAIARHGEDAVPSLFASRHS